MRIPGLKTAKVFSQWLQARTLGGAIILGYHSIANGADDAYEICVTPEHFADHMQLIRKYAHPISLTQLVHHLKENSLPARSIVVTFDDGYADNLHGAKPILETYQIPATFFICTGYLGKEFWWDEMARLVRSSRANPSELSIVSEDRTVQSTRFASFPASGGTEETSLRKQLCDSLYHTLLQLDFTERDLAMETIRRWAGVSSQGSTSLHALSPEELYKLGEGELFELCTHTRTHPMLPNLSLHRQREEIVSSKQDLEALLGRQVLGFAYPNGKAARETRALVRDAGFEYACISLRNVVRPGCDPYQLTRFWPEDVDGNKFMQGLKRWMAL